MSLLGICLFTPAIAASVSSTVPAKLPVTTKWQPLPVHVDGYLRSYYFTRKFSNPVLDQQAAFSLGGAVNVLTNPFWDGFRIGATLFTAQSLGLNSDDAIRLDRSVPGSPVTVLGQAFAQYDNKYVLARVGNQEIITPWENMADTRMIPATYQGVSVDVKPRPDVNLYAMRLNRFKARISSRFTQTNLFNPQNLAFTSIPALGNKTDIGTLAFGATYTNPRLNINAWAYRFYNYANLAYADVNGELDTNTLFKPIYGLQLANEWNDGNEVIKSLGLGDTHAQLFGALLGVEIMHGRILFGFNWLPKHAGAYENGSIVSPYTTSYMSDPLYTTSMIAGMVEKAAGTAFKVTAQYIFFAGALETLASYAKYNTQPYLHDSNETDFDVIFHPPGTFKHLSVRERLGFLNGNSRYGHYVYNRIMLQYDFLEDKAS